MTISRIVTIILGILLIGCPVSSAYGVERLAAPSVATDAPTGVLAEFSYQEVPSRHAEVWLMRISLDPGGTFPMWWPSGIMMYYVETGSIDIESNEPLLTTSPRAIEPREVVLLPGESVLAPEDRLVEASNTGETPATFLMVLMIFTTARGETDRMVDDATGYSMTSLAYGTAEFQPGPVTITLQRETVLPGDVLESPGTGRTDLGYGWMGFDAGFVETGMGRVEILHRSEQATIIRPDGVSLGGPYPPVKFETALTFPAGWGYFFYNSELTWTNSGEEPLTVLHVMVSPDSRD